MAWSTHVPSTGRFSPNGYPETDEPRTPGFRDDRPPFFTCSLPAFRKSQFSKPSGRRSPGFREHFGECFRCSFHYLQRKRILESSGGRSPRTNHRTSLVSCSFLSTRVTFPSKLADLTSPHLSRSRQSRRPGFMRPAGAGPKARPGGFFFWLGMKMTREEDGGWIATDEHGWYAFTGRG